MRRRSEGLQLPILSHVLLNFLSSMEENIWSFPDEPLEYWPLCTDASYIEPLQLLGERRKDDDISVLVCQEAFAVVFGVHLECLQCREIL